MPQTTQALVQSASVLSRSGRIDEALRILEQAAALSPEDLEPVLIAGILQARIGRHAEAIPRLERVFIADSSSFVAAYWLSLSYQKIGHREDATLFAHRAVSINPNDSMAHERLAYCHMETGNYAGAEACFLTALRYQPNNSAFIGGLGTALEGQGKVREAIGLFQRATQVNPKSATSYAHLARLMAEEQESEGALLAARTAVSLRPDSDEARQSLVSSLLQSGKTEEAEHQLRELSQSDKPCAKLFAFLGWAWQALGKSTEARHAFDKALVLDPVEPEACLEIVRRRRMEQNDQPFLDKLETAAQSDRASPETLKSFHFALGKASEDLGRYEKAMGHFDEANRISRKLKFGKAAFSPEARSEEDAQFISRYSREIVKGQSLTGSTDEMPILVVGMMRSGTTLVEQILSCHRDIGGAGEISFWLKNRQKAMDKLELLKPLAEEYCALLKARAGEVRFAVDKMPNNYSVLPLIHMALPNARIIHVQRHPVDTCLSIWSTPNVARTDWAHDKDNVVFAYQQYRKLMSAWREVLPESAMLEIQYENLVAEPEAVTRRMIEFLGLEWDGACLHPHGRSSAVTTPSAWQVRQPMYTSSVGRWKLYESYLGAFLRLLK